MVSNLKKCAFLVAFVFGIVSAAYSTPSQPKFDFRTILVRMAAQGISLGLADSRYGAPPSPNTLGPLYGTSRGSSDVYGALANGYGPWSYMTMPMPPPYMAATPAGSSGKNYYINSCQVLTITAWTVGTNSATVAVSGGDGGVQAGDIISLQTLPGGIAGMTVGTYTVTSITDSATFVIACPTNTGIFTSGGTFYVIRNGMPPGNDSTGTGTWQAPWATFEKSQTGITLSQSTSAAASVTGGVNFTVGTSAGYAVNTYATVSGYTSGNAGYNGKWPISAVPDSTHVTVLGPTYVGSAAGTIKSAPGGVQVLANNGTYAENSGGNSRFILSQVYDNWVHFSSLTARRDDVVITNVSTANGVVNIRGSSAAKYSFDHLTFQPTSVGPTIFFNPSTTTVTINGLHFIDDVIQSGGSTSAIFFGALSTNIGNVISGTPTGGSGSNIVVASSNTGGLLAGQSLAFASVGGVTLSGVTRITSLVGLWNLASVVPNTSFTLANSANMVVGGGAISGTTTTKYIGTDNTANDVTFQHVLFTTNASGSDIFQASPLSPTLQPFTNIGFYDCATDLKAAYNGFCEGSISGVNGLTLIGDIFQTNVGHAFLAGSDVAGVSNSGLLGAAVTNLLVSCCYFNSGATSTNGHGAEMGWNVQGGVIEHTVIDGTLHGGVSKGGSNNTFRDNLVRMKQTRAIHIFVDKGAYNTQYLHNVGYINQANGYGLDSVNDFGASLSPAGPCVLFHNWLVTDNSSAVPLLWPTAATSSGGALEDYNFFDVRSSPANWGTLRTGSPTDLTSLKSGWSTYGLPAATLAISGTISGGGGSPVWIPFSATTLLTTGGYISITGVNAAVNGIWQIGELTSTAAMLVNSTGVASQSGSVTGTCTYQFADSVANDWNSQINTTPNGSAPYGTRNDIVWVGGAANKNLQCYAEFIYQDGTIFNGLNREPKMGREQRYAMWMLESVMNSSGTYTCPVPLNLPSGNWTVVVRIMRGYLASPDDPIVLQTKLGYGS